MNNYDCAIVVMSCDAYSDLWNGFFSFKNKYWKDCPFTSYLVANHKRCEEKDVNTILCGDDLNWTGRLIKTLNEIPESYIILMLEDYYISDYVNTKDVINALSFMKENEVSYYKIETRGTKFSTIYKDSPYIRIITPDIRYGVSLITSIWNKGFLLQVIGGEDYPAWEFEIRRNLPNDITRVTDKLLLCDTRNLLHITHMVQRGKYLRRVLKKVQSRGDIIDVGDRGKISIFFEPYATAVSALKNHKKARRFVLRLLHIFHFKSVSEKYEDEIKRGAYK